MSIQRPFNQTVAHLGAKYKSCEMMGSKTDFEARARNRQGESRGARIQIPQNHANYADSITDTGMTKFQGIAKANAPTTAYFGVKK